MHPKLEKKGTEPEICWMEDVRVQKGTNKPAHYEVNNNVDRDSLEWHARDM